jgi:hypothetical protein
MVDIITPLLAILAQIAPGATTDLIANAIKLLVALIPVIIKEYQDLMPTVQGIIDVLKQSDDVTDDQWNQLDQISAQADADFQAALAAAKAQDAAAAPKT